MLQFSALAQSTYQLGALPSLNINKKLQNDWSVNTKLESRQLFQKGEINGISDKEYSYILTDLSLIAAKKIGLNSRIAAGYLVRLKNGVFFHRFIQQYVLIQRMTGFRLAHRIMFDQTFSEAEDPEFRFRYRITSEIPLDGETINPGEFYLKLNNEYVHSLQASEYDLEVRLVPLIGYDISKKFKIETGLDYRVSSFINDKTKHSYWVTINLFMEL